ncbi:unnamed protein product [Alternaria burnsii]|nr:unnamed protein product [Alternaria burnsii]
MAVPFGFSAGDFMAAIHLVHEISTALRETDGASSQYNQTIGQLQGLERLLRSVQSAYSADVDPQQLEMLQLLGHQCHIPLNKFFSKIKTLEPSLGSLGMKNDRIFDRAKRAARKVKWGVQIRKEVSELNAAMGGWINAINMQLLLINFERQEKAGSPLETSLQPLDVLNSEMNSFQNHLDARFGSLATTTTVDNIAQTLQDMRLEAVNDRNTQMDTIRKHIENHMGRFDTGLSQQVLESIKLLDSKVEEHLARSIISTTPNTAMPSPVFRPFIPADPRLSFQDNTAMQRVEDQLAAQTRLLQRLEKRDMNPQSANPLFGIKSNGMIQSAQRTIRQSIQTMLSFFGAGVNALLMKLCIALPVIQHILRTLRVLPLLISIPISDSILFEDALGRIVHLPYVHFRHYAVFMARLRCEFENVPGEQKVLLEQFRIFRRKHFDEFLTKDNWDSAVRPGSKIAMSIQLDSYDDEGVACPRCENIRTDMNTKDLSQCTVCGLSWTLQKFNLLDMLSNANRVHEATSSTSLQRDTFEVAENVSSSSSTSSPNHLEAALPSRVNEGIESFKMVHIQSQNASAQPYQPRGFRDFTVDFALCAMIQQSIPPRQGSIYMFWREDSPQIVKIGASRRAVEELLRGLNRSCGKEYVYDEELYKGTKMVVPFAPQVERLIFTELKNYRIRIECSGCSKSRQEAAAKLPGKYSRMRNTATTGKVYHRQWFCVSKGHALKVFQKWKAWIMLDPYMENVYGEWVLKPSFLANTSGICRPLTIED